jgi:hypothetical protein
MKRYFLIAVFLASFFSFAFAQNDSKLPQSDPAFNGKIDATRDSSKPIGHSPRRRTPERQMWS